MVGLGMTGYRDRVIDVELAAALAAGGAVVIEGPKACGKTETALRQARSVVRLDIDSAAQQAAVAAAELVLKGERPRLIDEWQTVPMIWNHIRRAVDDAGAPGQFILTGSATPREDATRHTGAGRFSFVRMRPMTLFEVGASTGEISLAALFGGESPAASDSGLTIGDLAEAIARGGWPGLQVRPLSAATKAVADYSRQISQVDIREASGARYVDAGKVRAVMRSIARNVATEATNTRIAADAGGAEGPLSTNTVADYLAALERLHVLEDQPAWGPHLRSKARTRSSVKRHFVDPSVAAAMLNASTTKLLNDPNFLGLLFESLVVRDVRVLAQPLGGRILHYRDSSDVEVDVIIELDDGRWAALEVKLGAGLVDEGCASLLRFVRQIDTSKCGDPSFLAVVCGNGYGYQRPDGVHVIPIGALGP